MFVGWFNVWCLVYCVSVGLMFVGWFNVCQLILFVSQLLDFSFLSFSLSNLLFVRWHAGLLETVRKKI